MLTLLRQFKKWLLGLSFKVQRPLPETPSGEIKVKGTDSLNELVRAFEDNKPVVQREQWFPTANNLMDADFDLQDSWKNHSSIPEYEYVAPVKLEEVLITKIGRFKDEVMRTKYEPHRDTKPKTVKYGVYDYPLTPDEVYDTTPGIVWPRKMQETIDNYHKAIENEHSKDDTHTQHTSTEHSHTNHSDSTHTTSDSVRDDSDDRDD